MFHQYKKSSSYLRAAIFKSYDEKCFYCGRTIQQRDMHIDHIIPSNMREVFDDEIKNYITELEGNGFIVDSIENYVPSCSACNISKNNKVFKASNLRFFHEKASSHVESILKIIEGLNGTTELFYEPIDTDIWEEVNFSYQRDLSHAIMGYRLTSADVEACPRFPQVDKIKKQLSIVDYTVIAGETGCGKSISVYQAAYDFYKSGWKIYHYKATEDINTIIIQDNTELSLYIIDDAQQLSERILNSLKEQARPNAKILIAKTISSAVKQDTILLTNKEAVDLMYSCFFNKKEDILPIVHMCDERIGINFMEQSIESRLREAKEAVTPWQFNYILRGGWQNMKERYQVISSHNNCDILATTIAVFQILRLDHSVDFNWICDELYGYDNSFIWSKSDLHYLINNILVLSEDDVRIVHMESAKRIIALFFKDSEENKKHILLRFIEKSFVKKHFSPLGLVWLCNGVSSYSSIYNINEYFITEKMIASALEDLDYINSSEERMGITYFWEKVFNLKYEKNGKYYFLKHKKMFLEWIQNADSKTAYAYSKLLNILGNKDINQHRKFVQEIDWTSLQESMLRECDPSLYSWGKLYNRLTYSLTKKEYLLVGKMLESAIERLCETATILNIEELTCFLCSVMYTNLEYVHNAIDKLNPIYNDYFKKNMSQAIHLFDFEFLMCVCGISLLGGYRAKNIEKKSAGLIVSVIPEAEFAEVIMKCSPRDWHTIHPIMNLIGHYDQDKAKRIVNFIDLNRLTKSAKDSWGQSLEITELCDILYTGNYKLAQKFIKNNLDKIQLMYSSLVVMSPKSAIEAFDKGIKIDLLTEHWWHISLLALKKLNKIDTNKTQKILLKSISEIVKRINSVTALDFNEKHCLEFLKLIKEIDNEIFNTIVIELDIVKIENNWSRGSIDFGKEKLVAKRKELFYELIKR